MKKSKTMRVAAAMLIAVLLTTCALSSTFAKYTTSANAQEVARIAKFGVTAKASGAMFGTQYQANTAGSGKDEKILYTATGGTVKADSKDAKVIAPGTQNKTGVTFSVEGTSEVSTSVTYGEYRDASGGLYKNSEIQLATGEYGVMVKKTPTLDDIVAGDTTYYTVASNKYSVIATSVTAVPTGDIYVLQDEVNNAALYLPITWTAKVGAEEASDYTTLKAAGAAITTGLNATVAPNASLAAKTATLTWSWPIEVGATTVDKSVRNKKDTILGDMMSAAKNAAAAPAVVVKVGSDWINLKYSEVNVSPDNGGSSKSVNKAFIAYPATVSTPATAVDANEGLITNVKAVLTETFAGALTVSQVD